MISIDRPLLIAHRTAMGLCPENTIVGIEAAIGSGVDGVEIDVRVTRDGVPVLMHDASLERTTGDARDVEAVTLGELRELSVIDPHGDTGPQPVPTFEEALAATVATHLVIEVKQTGIEEVVARAVRDARTRSVAARCARSTPACARPRPRPCPRCPSRSSPRRTGTRPRCWRRPPSSASPA